MGWSAGISIIIPLESILSNSLKKVLLVHHDSTPQSNISSHGVRDLSEDQCGYGFLDPGITLGIEGNELEIGADLVNERQNDAKGCIDASHGEYLDVRIGENVRCKFAAQGKL
jgi:hypothetical protein